MPIAFLFDLINRLIEVLYNEELPSWSGLSRPSTFSLVQGRVQDVDARHKGEHDVSGFPDKPNALPPYPAQPRHDSPPIMV